MNRLLMMAAGFVAGLAWPYTRRGGVPKRAGDLRALRRHFELLTRYATDGVLLLDEDRRVVDANGIAVAAFGYSREQLVGKGLCELRDPAALGDFETTWNEILAAGGLAFETRYRRSDGTIFPADVSVRVLAVGERTFCNAYIRDITARKAMEEQLRRALDNLSAVVEASPAAIIALDPEGVVTMWNKAAERILGWTAEEVVGGFLPCVPPHKREEHRSIRERVLAGSLSSVEVERVRKDGEPITLRVSTAPLHDAGGRVVGIMSLNEDVTERGRNEEARRRTQALLNLVIEGTSDCIFVKDCEGRYLMANSACAVMAGLSRDALLGKDDSELFGPEVAEAMLRQDHAVMESKSTVTFEERVTFQNGNTVDYLTTKGPILDAAGSVAGLFGIARDITESKRAGEERARLQEQLQQAQKMESVGRLAGGVAHDFNNLLTVINGYADLMLSLFDPNDPQREWMVQIRDAGQKAAALTQQLLAFSRKQLTEPRVISLNQIVGDLTKMLHRLLGEDIELVTSLDPGLGNAMADPGQIQQVLMNLAVNARDAMPGGGKLIIETSNIRIDESYVAAHAQTAPGDYVLMTITDTGIGMDEQTQRRVFEPFFTTKGKGLGTGLGLSTVYGIVKQSGGWIWLYSEPEKGSTFKIYLPRVDREAEDLPRHGTARNLHGTETLLVVEDQEEVRQLAVRVLRGFGYSVLEAPDALQAMQAIGTYSGPIHLMITDVVMPGITGRQLAERLAPSRPEMKVLYISGYTENVIAHQGVLDPGVAYLPKPFSPDALGAKVREVLDAPAE